MEKPKSIEIGQRYRGVFSKQVFTVVARMGRDWHVEYDDGEKTSMRNPSAEGGFLGYGPQPPPVQSVGEVNGFPVACLGCGGDKGKMGFVCEACSAIDNWHYGHGLITAWEAGERNFPRPPTPTETPTPSANPACPLGSTHGPAVASCACGYIEPCRGEARSVYGVALSRINHIQARKPPEPWVPSCDIDADIPDAY